MAGDRDHSKDERRRRAQKARDAYRREYERRRAERSKPDAVKVPPFDPEKFVDLERQRSKATLLTITFAAGATAALVAAGALAGIQAWTAFLSMLLIGALYPYLKWVWDIDMTKLGRPTSAVGLWFAYFVTWLMVSFIMSNPPFADYSAPEIFCCEYAIWAANNATWLPVNATSINHTSGPVRVIVRVIDNMAVKGVTLERFAPNGSRLDVEQMVPSTTAENRWNYDFTSVEAGSYTLNFLASDAAGHQASLRASMSVS